MTRTAKDKPAMTLIAALSHPEYRQLIDAIEDMIVSLRGREGDKMLEDALEAARRELEEKTGINYLV